MNAKFRAMTVALAALAAVALFLLPGTARAHPLGNFTINRYGGLEIGSNKLRLLYIVDMAEVPAFQEIQSIDSDRSRVIDRDEERAYLDAKVPEIAANLSLTVDGRPLRLVPVSSSLTFPPGQGGLATLRLEVTYEAGSPASEAGDHELAYEDANFEGRLGWKEVVARATGEVTIRSSTVPADDRTDRLQTYPDESLTSPLDVRSASVVFAVVGGAERASVYAVAPGSGRAGGDEAAAVSTPDAQPSSGTSPKRSSPRSTDPLGELLRRERLTPGVIVLALAMAVGVGGFHALTPGHGKTIMAAYLVGTRGASRHAVMLGATVAASHTIGVLALGAVTVYAAKVLAPDAIYPYLGFGAGVIVLGIGAWMLVRRLLRSPETKQVHDHHLHTPEAHSHDGGGSPDPHSHVSPPDHGHGHSHEGDTAHAGPRPQLARGSGITWRTLLAVGLADGAVPSASALILWLAAISIDRVGFGFVMVAAFGVGMAAVLTGIGLVLVRGRGLFEARVAPRFPAAQRINQALPWITAIVVIGAGAFLIVRAAIQAGLL